MNQLDNEPKVSAWIRDVTGAGCSINGIRTLQEIRKKDGELLFALLDTEVRSPEETRLPNIIFIRGHACVVVPLLRNRSTGEQRFLMVSQRRIGNGQLSVEFPAGMLDAETDPVPVALRELSEETGLELLPEELFPLYDGMLYSSAGACDEAIYYFGCIKELDDGLFRTFLARKGGNPHEEEHITVSLMSRPEAQEKATSLQVLLGFFLFEQYLKRNGISRGADGAGRG